MRKKYVKIHEKYENARKIRKKHEKRKTHEKYEKYEKYMKNTKNTCIIHMYYTSSRKIRIFATLARNNIHPTPTLGTLRLFF